MLLSRLGRLCVFLPLLRWFSAAIGPKLDPSFLAGFPSEAVPPDSIVIHGECDETVPLARVLDWARPQELPIVVVPGADHFFHLRLNIIRDIVKNSWRS